MTQPETTIEGLPGPQDHTPDVPAEADGEASPRPRPGWWRWGKWILQVGIPLLVVWLVWHEIRSLDVGRVREALAEADIRLIVYGIGCAFVALIVAGLYDAIAFPKGKAGTLGYRRRWLLGSILFGWTNFIAVGPMGGPALRLLTYRKYGLTGAEITRGLVGLYVALSSGFIALQLAAWLPGPLNAAGYLMRAVVALVGSVSCAIAGRSIVIPILRRNRYGGELGDIPAVRLGVVSFVEWGLVLLSFQMLISAGGVNINPLEATRTVLTGYAGGFASMIPGGLGTADAIWFKGFEWLEVPQEQAAAGILLFRAGFYLAPWIASVIALGSAVLILKTKRAQT